MIKVKYKTLMFLLIDGLDGILYLLKEDLNQLLEFRGHHLNKRLSKGDNTPHYCSALLERIPFSILRNYPFCFPTVCISCELEHFDIFVEVRTCRVAALTLSRRLRV